MGWALDGRMEVGRCGLTSWIEISQERLRANYEVLQEAAGEAAVLAVVKANAYGHGLERCAQVLAGSGAEWLGVTGVEAGALVRRALSAAGLAAGAQPRVLVMGGLSREDAEGVVAEGLTPVVWTVEQVGWLSAAAGKLGETVAVHVEVDSGMTRQGVRPGPELVAVVRAIEAAAAVRLHGVMTHFASAEVAGSTQTVAQKRRFEAALAEVAAAGASPAWVSVGNTSGADLVEDPEDLMAWVARLAAEMGARAMVRAGLGLYGYCLELEEESDAGVAGGSRLAGRLQPVMTWKAKVIGVEAVPAGVAVGYCGTFVTERPMRLGLVAAGYADGLRRELSSTNACSGGWVVVQGCRAPIVGRVSMNLTSVDVSGIEGVRVGDDAVLLGDGVTAEDHAGIAGTIAYEILCGVRAVERGG
jgi:alanine racemase